MGQWSQFLEPYKQAVDELKIKLKGYVRSMNLKMYIRLSNLSREG